MLVHVRRSLADFLLDEMERLEITTVTELAATIRVTAPTARRLLEGHSTPREETLAKIADAFDVSIEELQELVRPPSLSTFLRSKLAEPELSSTKKLGEFMDLSQATAWGLINRPGRIPKQGTLDKIAHAFGLSPTEVREMARRPLGEPERIGWPAEFDQLTAAQRDLLFKIGRQFIDDAGLGRVTR